MKTDSTRLSPRSRHDGWNAPRQLAFLHTLALTRSVTSAARAAGMSRESAYRLRTRREGALFAFRWDQILCPDRALPVTSSTDHKGHAVGAALASADSAAPSNS